MLEAAFRAFANKSPEKYENFLCSETNRLIELYETDFKKFEEEILKTLSSVKIRFLNYAVEQKDTNLCNLFVKLMPGVLNCELGIRALYLIAADEFPKDEEKCRGKLRDLLVRCNIEINSEQAIGFLDAAVTMARSQEEWRMLRIIRDCKPQGSYSSELRNSNGC